MPREWSQAPAEDQAAVALELVVSLFRQLRAVGTEETTALLEAALAEAHARFETEGQPARAALLAGIVEDLTGREGSAFD